MNPRTTPRRVSSRGLTARMLRRRPGPGLVVAVLSIVLAAVVATVPIVLASLNDRIAREAVQSLSPGSRDLTANAIGYLEGGSPPGGVDVGLSDTAAEIWGAFDADLERAREATARPLRPLLGRAEYTVRNSAGEISGGTGNDSLGYIADPRYRDHAVLVEGAWPAPFELATTDEGPTGAPTLVEIALSADTATWLEWKVGEVRTSGQWRGFETPESVPVKLVGIFTPKPGSDDYWYHLESVLKPHVTYHDGVPFPAATGFVAPESVFHLPEANQLRAWYPLESAGMTAKDLPLIAAQLRAFTARPVDIDAGSGAGAGTVSRLEFATEAVPTLEHALDTQGAMTAVFAITASGPAGAAIAVLAVACRVIARSRRPALALLSARGASPGRLRALQAWHGFWFGSVPALATGGVLAGVTTTVGIPPSPWAAVGVAVVAALPAAILGAMRPPGPHLQDEVAGESTRAQRRRRLAVELVVAVLAVLAAAALVSGALAGDRVGSRASATSLFVVVAPLLAALAGCVVALRLFPLPLRALLTRERRRRGLTGFLGAARALRESAAGVAPVLALLIGVSSATMSGVLLGSIQHEIDGSAGAAVGADMQLARVELSDDLLTRLTRVPGVAAVAPIGSVTVVTIRGDGSDHVTATMLVVDPKKIAAVQDTTAPLLPAGSDLDARGPLHIVLAQLASTQLDGVTDVSISSQKAKVTGVSPLAAPQGITEVWGAIAESRLKDITDESPDVRNALVRLAPSADPAAVTRAVRDVVGDEATILTAGQMRDELSQRTGTNAIRTALLAATAAAALFAALAVVLSLVLSAPARDRLLALLRALGAPSRVGRGLAWWELWPALAASVVVGLAVGLAVPALLLATVDFGVFIDTEPAYHLDPLLLGGALAGFLALVTLFTVAALALSRRVRATSVLRQTQEG